MVKGSAPEARTVLIVDDHDDLRDAMRTLLESWGHTVRAASNGRQALALALSWRPDIVCLDLGLPVMSGYDVATRIIAACGAQRPTLIALSGFSRAVDRQKASHAGFDAFIAKPDQLDLLRDLLADGPSLSTRAVPTAVALRAGGSRA